MMKLLTAILLFCLSFYCPQTVLATDSESIQEFQIREKALSDKFDNFYVRQKEISEEVKQRRSHSQVQAEYRTQILELRDYNRRSYKRPKKISNEEAERLYEEIKSNRAAKRTKLQSFYVTKKKRENRIREGLKKIPGKDEFSLPEYGEILWSKEKAQKMRGQ